MNRQNDVSSFNPFVITSAHLKAGETDKYLSDVADAKRQLIGKAELLYYRGYPSEADTIAQVLLADDDGVIALGAFLIKAMLALHTGDVKSVLADYVKICGGKNDELIKTGDFFRLYFNIMVHNVSNLKFPEVSVHAFDVQPELKPMAVYAYSRFLYVTGDIGRSIGLSEGGVVFLDRPCPVPEIYLSLMTAAGYVSRQLWSKAEYYFMHAWRLAEPDGIIMPFAEFRSMLSGLLERCMRYDYPSEYKRITELSSVYRRNWIRVHNSLTDDKVSDKLTGIEFNIATLAARGVSNMEIADYLGISVNSVRAHLRNIFNKLGVDSRKKLSDYVIM